MASDQMNTPALPRYTLRTIKDFASIPAERLTACIEDFQTWLRFFSVEQHLSHYRSKHPLRALFATPEPVFEWVDVGRPIRGQLPMGDGNKAVPQAEAHLYMDGWTHGACGLPSDDAVTSAMFLAGYAAGVVARTEAIESMGHSHRDITSEEAKLSEQLQAKIQRTIMEATRTGGILSDIRKGPAPGDGKFAITGKLDPVEPEKQTHYVDAGGKVLPMDKMKIAHWMVCTAEWNLDQSIFFRVGDTIELDSADFERQMATLKTGMTDVGFRELMAHAEVMPGEQVRAMLLKQSSTSLPANAVAEMLSDPAPDPVGNALDKIEQAKGVAAQDVDGSGATFDGTQPETPVGSEAVDALEKANPGAPGLIGVDDPGVYVFLGDILGQFARFAVSQSPYHHPEGLLEVLDAIKADIGEHFDPNLGWAKLNWRQVENMLNEAIMAMPQVSAWNRRKNGNDSVFAFDGAIPDKRDPNNDFIDLGALMRNTAMACASQAAESEHHNAALASLPVSPQPAVEGVGLWRYNEKIGGCKFLVMRRDGTVPDWPYFVLGARDMAAVHAMGAYAWYASLLKYDPKFVADCERFAKEMAAYRAAYGPGDPTAPPHRKDDPAVIAKMQHARGA